MHLTRIFTRQATWMSLVIILFNLRITHASRHWSQAYRIIGEGLLIINKVTRKKVLIVLAALIVIMLFSFNRWNTAGFPLQSASTIPRGGKLGKVRPNLQGQTAIDYLKPRSFYDGILNIDTKRSIAIHPYFTEIKKLTALDGGVADYFGSAVAISGNTAIVGAYDADNGNIFGNGAAYIFERSKDGTNNWVEVKKLIPTSEGDSGEFFGSSVAISGDTVIVAAVGDNIRINNGLNFDQGSAFVFERNRGGTNNWGLVKKLLASDGAQDDLFGASVAIQGDTAIIGANGDDNQRGSAYVLERNKGGANNWGEVKKLVASDGASFSNFGVVALSNNMAIVGALNDNDYKGSAYIFERNNGGANNWGEVKKLMVLDVERGQSFGESVAISEGIVLVGASGRFYFKGAAYVFEQNRGGANNWGLVKKLTSPGSAVADFFGQSVALSGGVALVGATGVSNLKGTTYLYERNRGGANNWGEVRQLIAPDGVADDYFGTSVRIDGDTVLIGASGDDGLIGNQYNQGSAYVFTFNDPPTINSMPIDQLEGTQNLNTQIATVGHIGDPLSTLSTGRQKYVEG